MAGDVPFHVGGRRRDAESAIHDVPARSHGGAPMARLHDASRDGPRLPISPLARKLWAMSVDSKSLFIATCLLWVVEACGDAGSVIVIPNQTTGSTSASLDASASSGGGFIGVGGGQGGVGASGANTGGVGGVGGIGEGGATMSSSDSSAVTSTTTDAVSVASSTAVSTSVASSSSGGGMTCAMASDCGSASCGWACTAGTCVLSAKPKFTPCYQDGGDGASCDGAGNCEVWVPISETNAPTPRYYHSAIWTGSKMIVWGGFTKAGLTNSGHAYDPVTDSWSAISGVNAPGARHSHAAVWTGTRMIVWGGFGNGTDANVGGIYDPSTNTWAAMATTSQPPVRQSHAMVYTGSKVLVWGGRNGGGAVNSGGTYDVATNTWTSMSGSGLKPRFNFSYGWIKPNANYIPDGGLFVWGGTDNFDWFKDGSVYNPVKNTWAAVDMTLGAPPNGGAPPPTLLESATAFQQNQNAGSGLFIFGGWNGGDYYGDTLFFWTTQANALDGYWYKLKQGDPASPSSRAKFTGFVLQQGILLWGGCNGMGCGNLLGDGGVWRPGANGGTWKSFPEDPALSKRTGPAGVWTGQTASEVIIWGGNSGGPVGTGARRAVSPNGM